MEMEAEGGSCLTPPLLLGLLREADREFCLRYTGDKGGRNATLLSTFSFMKEVINVTIILTSSSSSLHPNPFSHSYFIPILTLTSFLSLFSFFIYFILFFFAVTLRLLHGWGEQDHHLPRPPYTAAAVVAVRRSSLSSQGTTRSSLLCSLLWVCIRTSCVCGRPMLQESCLNYGRGRERTGGCTYGWYTMARMWHLTYQHAQQSALCWRRGRRACVL